MISVHDPCLLQAHWFRLWDGQGSLRENRSAVAGRLGEGTIYFLGAWQEIRWLLDPFKEIWCQAREQTRAVDDFSEFLINASVTATEKLQLFGLDEVVNTARTFLGRDFWWWMKVLTICGAQKVSDFCGPWKKILERALDLKSAYKQLARHPADGWASILAVWNADTSAVEFYEAIALPFGPVCAVMAFNRMAKSLRLILSELFTVVNTNFFDDFCQLECEGLCNSAWETAELVRKLLGWRISMSEDKRSPFSEEFNLLEAVVDLTKAASGTIAVHNKPSRINDLQSLVESICESETVALSTLETLKGRLLYAAGHTFGRCSQLAIQLTSRVSRRGPLVLMEEPLKEGIKQALSCLMDAKPRKVSAWSGRLPNNFSSLMVPVRMTVNASLMGQHFTIQKTAQLSCLATMCLPIGLRSGEQKVRSNLFARPSCSPSSLPRTPGVSCCMVERFFGSLTTTLLLQRSFAHIHKSLKTTRCWSSTLEWTWSYKLYTCTQEYPQSQTWAMTLPDYNSQNSKQRASNAAPLSMISREDELGWKACDTKVSYANTKACRLPNLLKEEKGDLNIKASAVSFPSCITSGCAASFALICIIYISFF